MTNDRTDEKKADRRVLIIRYGEVALKGMNKPYFERVLLERLRFALRDLAGGIRVEREDGLIVAYGKGGMLPCAEDALIRRISKVFGVASVSPAVAVFDRDIRAVSAAATEFMRGRLMEREGIDPTCGAPAPMTF
ncbi:MAG: hypothetical protein LBL63_00815, partial [Clostridiales Family XIII bacterium]|nr:hypothetical protein [Clostridiales Family XIII bacterium]